MKAYKLFAIFISLLLLLGLACSAAGEVLSPEEATQRAQPTALPQTGGNGGDELTFAIDDTVEFVSSEFLILLRNTPGDLSNFATQATRGETATILDSTLVDGEEWYRVKGPAGEGWVQARYLSGTGSGAGGETEGPQVGDTVYLAGVQFLIPLVAAPGETRMIAGQERGVEVTILETFVLEGETWYRIDAPTGEGWVPADKISTEAP